MAVKYIAVYSDHSSVTAKEISEGYNIPYELLSKVLQKLSKFNIVKSFQGVKGGYSLTRTPEEISLIDIISIIEPHYSITECLIEHGSEKDCARFNCCMIRDPLAKVQSEIDKVFRTTTISQIL